MALFHAKGRHFRYDDDLFTLHNSVMLRQGFAPEGYDPVVDALDTDRRAGALDQMRQVIERMPAHADFVRAHCLAASR